jgi:putative hydrolase of the HAD superfamily
MTSPRAFLLDLDDTILDDSSAVHECWRGACVTHAGRLAPLDVALVVETIENTSKRFWGDPERHRAGRLELDAARRTVVRLALSELGVDDRQLGDDIGDAYSQRRDITIEPLPDAIATVRWLRDTGRRLALVTNGGGAAQRKKLLRFGLTDLFDAILVEGELGFGKPDRRVYQEALSTLDVPPSEAWMIGDNLEFDVVAPQRLGMVGVWVDASGRGVPDHIDTRPNHIVRCLPELRSLVERYSG